MDRYDWHWNSVKTNVELEKMRNVPEALHLTD